ncbi:MAG TPA: alpha/beta hydrolase [Ktedonobacterales bacterium]
MDALKTIELQHLKIAYCSNAAAPQPSVEQPQQAQASKPTPAKEAVVLLHGWGCSIQTVLPIYEYLAPNYAVYALDFPGCGGSDQPSVPWSVAEYVQLTLDWLNALQIPRATFIGHSHGGRVSLTLAAQHPERVKRLILVDSAGIRAPRNFRYYRRVYFYKVAKRVIALPGIRRYQPALRKRLMKLLGSEDYGNVSPGVMQGTFIKLVNEDLRPVLKSIKAPALLIWGENDQDTPVSDGKIMEQEIPDAGLVVLKGAGHFSYLDCFPQFCAVISSFLSS